MKVILKNKSIELNLGNKKYISMCKIVMDAESITYSPLHGFAIRFNSLIEAKKAYKRVRERIPSVGIDGLNVLLYHITDNNITISTLNVEGKEPVLNVEDGWYYPETRVKEINVEEMEITYKTVGFIPCEAPSAEGIDYKIIVNIMHGHIFQTIREVPCTN